jgi:hypothetical protein
VPEFHDMGLSADDALEMIELERMQITYQVISIIERMKVSIDVLSIRWPLPLNRRGTHRIVKKINELEMVGVWDVWLAKQAKRSSITALGESIGLKEGVNDRLSIGDKCERLKLSDFKDDEDISEYVDSPEVEVVTFRNCNLSLETVNKFASNCCMLEETNFLYCNLTTKASHDWSFLASTVRLGIFGCKFDFGKPRVTFPSIKSLDLEGTYKFHLHRFFKFPSINFLYVNEDTGYHNTALYLPQLTELQVSAHSMETLKFLTSKELTLSPISKATISLRSKSCNPGDVQSRAYKCLANLANLKILFLTFHNEGMKNDVIIKPNCKSILESFVKSLSITCKNLQLVHITFMANIFSVEVKETNLAWNCYEINQLRQH